MGSRRHSLPLFVTALLRRAIWLFGGLTSLGVGWNAVAATQTDDIVVTAVPRDERQLQRAVSRFVRTISQIAAADQLAQRNSPFCPRVIGLEDAFKPVVLEKLREAGRAAGVPEGPSGCLANLVIIFAPDADVLVRDLNRKRPSFFARIKPDKAREIFESGRRVRWWYGHDSADSDGAPIIGDKVMRYSASLISTGISVNLSGTVVIIDVQKVSGFPLMSIASYAAMISFAQITGDERKLADVPSVLGIFARPGPREGALQSLTDWDRAYLHALYKIPSDRPAYVQKSRLTGKMKEALLVRP